MQKTRLKSEQKKDPLEIKYGKQALSALSCCCFVLLLLFLLLLLCACCNFVVLLLWMVGSFCGCFWNIYLSFSSSGLLRRAV